VSGGSFFDLPARVELRRNPTLPASATPGICRPEQEPEPSKQAMKKTRTLNADIHAAFFILQPAEDHAGNLNSAVRTVKALGDGGEFALPQLSRKHLNII
jgi:hypothetical protein